MDYFHTEEICRKEFAKIRFAAGEYCPYCEHAEIYKFSGGKRYRCAGCKSDFSIKTGTIFGDSKLPLRKWFMAIYLLSSSAKGMSSIQLSKHLGVTQKTAWFMAHRIRKAHKQETRKLRGKVEADETYIGGKAKNMHSRRRREIMKGRGTYGKVPIFGLRTRTGKVRAQVIESTGMDTLHYQLKSNMARGATLYTDEWMGYNRLGRIYKRGVVQHGVGEYVRGKAHINGIESFWALFKRGYHGTYHSMSKKHLQRYVDEFVVRFNNRLNPPQRIFHGAVQSAADTGQLTYESLTA
ncbi:MAG TPA: IS1595 family transposase [Verrucomicrobiae bacterium]